MIYTFNSSNSRIYEIDASENLLIVNPKLTFILSFTFLFLFSGSVYGEEPETEDKTCFQVYPNKIHPNKETIISKDDDCIFSITMDKWYHHLGQLLAIGTGGFLE